MTTPAVGPHDDYIDRLNAEVERRLAYLVLGRARWIARSHFRCEGDAQQHSVTPPARDCRTRSMTNLFGDASDQHDHGCKRLIRLPPSWQVEVEFDGPGSCW